MPTIRPSIVRRGMLVVGIACIASLFGPAARGAELAQTSPERCSVEGDVVVSPTRVRLGDSVQVRITLTPDCPEAEYRSADIVLAIDRSLSMLSNGKLAAAKDAASQFVANTDLSLQRIGIVGFHSQAELAIGLSADEAAITSAIDGLMIRTGTNMMEALDVAQQELEDRGRADAKPVIVLITDGSPNQPPQNPDAAALRSANAAKLAGTEIYTIGLGSGAAETLLQQIASGEDNYFFSPGTAELTDIYESIALVVGARTLRDLALDVTIAADLGYVDASAVPVPAAAGQDLEWMHGIVPSDGLTWSFQVTPNRVGTYEVADRMEAEYLDIDGERRTYAFPPREVTVVDPRNRGCAVRDMWTVLVHSFPDPSGVSSQGRGCDLRFGSSDWLGGTAQPLPALTYRLSDATGDLVLFEGQAVPGPGRVDQWLYIRTCTPPPYRLELITSGLGGYTICENGPAVREITTRDFRPRNYRNTLEPFGFVR